MGVAQEVLIGLGLVALVLPRGQVQAQSAQQTPARQAHLAGTVEQGLDGTSPYGTPETDSEGVLREMAGRAAVIFVGTVTAVRKGAVEDLRSNAASSIVEVDFSVEHSVKGVTEGSIYALREWAGLWRDSPRFAVGQRLLMLLHAAGPGGLSSPIDGLDGAIPVKATDALPTLAGRPMALATKALATNAANDSSQSDATHDDVVDLRWLQARTLRVQTFADEPVASPGEAAPVAFAMDAPLVHATGMALPAAAEPATAAGLTHVLGLLVSWRETGNVSR